MCRKKHPGYARGILLISLLAAFRSCVPCMHIPVVVVYEHRNICPFMRSCSDSVDALSEMPKVDRNALITRSMAKSKHMFGFHVSNIVKWHPNQFYHAPTLMMNHNGWARAAELACTPPCIGLRTFCHKGSLGIVKQFVAV